MLIQVLVGLVISGIALQGMIMLTTQQATESAGLAEKLVGVEMQRLLTATVTDTNLCTSMITNGIGPVTVNLANPAQAEVAIGTLSPTGSTPALATVGNPVSPAANSLVVSTIKLKNFALTPTADRYYADIVIDYDPLKRVRPSAPTVVNVILATTGSAGAKTVTGCLNKVNATDVWTPPIAQTNCNWYTTCQSNVFCPDGQYMAGVNTYTQSISQWGAWVCSRLLCCSPQ